MGVISRKVFKCLHCNIKIIEMNKVFSYRNEFKIQKCIASLSNFPTKDKEYNNCELWKL